MRFAPGSSFLLLLQLPASCCDLILYGPRFFFVFAASPAVVVFELLPFWSFVSVSVPCSPSESGMMKVVAFEAPSLETMVPVGVAVAHLELPESTAMPGR